MPSSIVKSFAKKSGKSVSEVEKLWKQIMSQAEDNPDVGNKFAYTTGTLKKILKLENTDMEILEKFVVDDITITLTNQDQKTGKKTKKIEALVDGVWALHNTYYDNKPLQKYYTVTHIPTSMGVMAYISKTDAKKLITELKKVEGFDKLTKAEVERTRKVPAEIMSQMKEIIPKYIRKSKANQIKAHRAPVYGHIKESLKTFREFIK